uniref:RRM domain-containing protein n=1 Tax=Parascaris univalens TaxID=6257 RepID=A0A915AG79_PARUN
WNMSWIIRLQRLPLSANAADIRTFFAGLRIPDGAVHIVGGPEGDAFIGFATDEDARQAMRYNDRRIHDQRVRLLLSSRVEMEAVIAKARAGDLGGLSTPSSVASPRRDEQQISTARAPTCSAPGDTYGVQRNAQPLVAQASSSTFAVRSGSHVNQANSEVSRQPDYPQQEFNRGSSSELLWGRNEPQSDSWKNNAAAAYDTRTSGRHSNGTPQSSQPAITPWQDAKMLNVLAQNATAVPPSSTLSIYQQSTRDERFGSYDIEGNFQGYKASVQPTVTSATESYSQGAVSSVDSRRIVPTQPKADVPLASMFQQGGLVPPVLPGQPLQMPPSIPGLVMPPLVASALPSVSAAQVLVTQSAAAASALPSANPFATAFPPQNTPIFPPMPVQRAAVENNDSCYVELSRLPTDLLRPAALEQFLRPSIPLTLSSVKVVFDPKGFPLHSLVRFECSKDAENILSRDGEQGIRIRASTREAFDTAVDGSVQVPSSSSYTHERGSSRNRESSRSDQPNLSSRRHHSSEKRDVDSRRDDRDHRNSRNSRGRDERSPHRARRRQSRTPPPRDYRNVKRRREDLERYCVEFTNLPFRVTEAEIRNFLGPRCEPMKASRAFKEDGQASDRWVIEFRTMDEAERAYRTRGAIQDRTVRARRLTTEEADALLSIPDKFGLQKKEEFERKHGTSTDTNLARSSSDGLLAPPFDSFNAFGNRQEPPVGPGGPLDNFSNLPSKQEPLLPLAAPRENFNAFNSGPTSFRSRMRFHGPPRALGPGMERDMPLIRSGPPTITNGPAGGPGFALNGPSTIGGLPPRLSGPRHPLLQGGPRPPLISPPSFFGATPASTIRQRGPPPPSYSSNHGPRPAGPPHLHHGPGPNAVASTSQNGHNNFPTPSLPPSAKSCVMLSNVPTTSTDSDLARFLGINSTRVNSSTVRRMPDNTVFVDLGSVEDAARAVAKCSRQQMGEDCILVSAISHQQMVEEMEKNNEQKELDPELVASLGEPGTVISCHGFPPDVTINDVAQFFDKFSLIESSVRIKLDDDGNSTGECLLAVGTPQEAAKAVLLLSGRRLNGATVTMSVVKPSVK